MTTPLVPIAGTAGGTATDSSRTASRDNLKAAGEKFEAVFTGMMLKSMRSTKLAEPLFDSKAIDTFTEMSDAQVGKAMAEHSPLGIGRAVTEFLSRRKPDLNPEAAKPAE